MAAAVPFIVSAATSMVVGKIVGKITGSELLGGIAGFAAGNFASGQFANAGSAGGGTDNVISSPDLGVADQVGSGIMDYTGEAVTPISNTGGLLGEAGSSLAGDASMLGVGDIRLGNLSVGSPASASMADIGSASTASTSANMLASPSSFTPADGMTANMFDDVVAKSAFDRFTADPLGFLAHNPKAMLTAGNMLTGAMQSRDTDRMLEMQRKMQKDMYQPIDSISIRTPTPPSPDGLIGRYKPVSKNYARMMARIRGEEDNR